MDDSKKLVEIMSEMLIEMQGMRAEQVETNKKLERVELRLEKVEHQIAKNNAGLGEVRLSVIRLTERMEEIAEHEKRIRALEKVVFKE